VFTKAYALKYGEAIKPNEYAVVTEKVEVEKGKTSIGNKGHNPGMRPA
jgi:hypothetical protein